MTTQRFSERILALQTNLLNFAYSLTSNRDDAYDLLQDTTLKVLDSEAMFKPNTNFKGWVFTIMRNLFINNYRRSVRAATVIDRSEDLYQINGADTTGDVTPDGTYTVTEITEMIKSFPDGYRIPFTMHLSGYRYAEIAEHLGLPVGTVKSRIFHARHVLRKWLAD